jgi:hypothetical protein
MLCPSAGRVATIVVTAIAATPASASASLHANVARPGLDAASDAISAVASMLCASCEPKCPPPSEAVPQPPSHIKSLSRGTTSLAPGIIRYVGAAATKGAERCSPRSKSFVGCTSAAAAVKGQPPRHILSSIGTRESLNLWAIGRVRPCRGSAGLRRRSLWGRSARFRTRRFRRRPRRSPRPAG